MIRFARRALLSAIFLSSSVNVIQNAEQMTAPAEALGLPEPEQFVRLHGAVNLLGGLMLALGIKPKLAAWALVGNLIPTTLGGHRFWEEDSEEGKMGQMVHFLKNVSLLGGLLTAIAAERMTDEDDR
ncbi:MAG: DoxX family protein [Actinobacteria bacterium]|nr:DoxX family protein [Actinomycetota bacterium]